MLGIDQAGECTEHKEREAERGNKIAPKTTTEVIKFMLKLRDFASITTGLGSRSCQSLKCYSCS